ncbi:MAG: DUF4870 domain-containing protein [bacterium]|nr:DUF4870 domain-containing protein [bacterium]
MAESNKPNTGYGILSYIGILIIIPFIDEKFKNTAYGKFHLNQALVLIIAWFATGVLSMIPVLGWIGGPIIALVLFVFWVMAVVGAAQGKMTKAPLIGGIELLK